MSRDDIYTAQFDEVSETGRRFTVHTMALEYGLDGAVLAVAEFDGHEYSLDVEDDDGITIYVREL